MLEQGRSSEGGASDAVTAYAEVLGRSGRVVDFDISGLDHLGVPVTSCSLLVDGLVAQNGNGYGLTTEAARLSGLGELAEGVLAADRVRELRRRERRASFTELVRREGAARVADPATLCLTAGSGWGPGSVITWVPVVRVRTGEEVWAPLDLVASDPADRDGVDEPLVTPVTNGLGAGLDDDRPLAHGILEILQRHTNGLRFRALDARSPEIDPAGIGGEVAALAARFAAEGVEAVFKHAATGFGVCSTYVMGVDADDSSPIRLTACGEAADPSVEKSLLKALLEHANSRARKAFCFGDREAARAVADPDYWAAVERGRTGGGGAGEPRAIAAMRAWHDLGAERLRALTAPDRSHRVERAAIEVPTGATAANGSAGALARLLDALAGHDVLAATTRVGEVRVAKVLVAGLEVETLSYGRIGELGAADLLATDLDLVRHGDGPTESHPARVVLTPEAEERLGGPVWYSYATAERIVGDRYPLYREPPRHLVEV